MDVLVYAWEVICACRVVILLMGLLAVPILWIVFEDDNIYESLDEYYNKESDIEK